MSEAEPLPDKARNAARASLAQLAAGHDWAADAILAGSGGAPCRSALGLLRGGRRSDCEATLREMVERT